MKLVLPIIVLVFTSLTSFACNLEIDAKACLIGQWQGSGCQNSKSYRKGFVNSWTNLWTFQDGQKVVGEFKYYREADCKSVPEIKIQNMTYELGRIISLGNQKAVQITFSFQDGGEAFTMRDLLSVDGSGKELFWGKVSPEKFPIEIDLATKMLKINDVKNKKPQYHLRENEASSTYGDSKKLEI